VYVEAQKPSTRGTFGVRQLAPLWVRELARGLAPQDHGTPQHRQQAGSGKAAASCRTPQPCTRHVIGASPGSDRTLLDNLLSDAIARTYKRCAIRYSNPIPTFNDLREELANWRDEERERGPVV